MGAAAVSANGTTAAAGSATSGQAVLHAQLHSLNNSGAFGSADVHVDGRRAHVDIDAYMLLKGMPHAQHIHFGQEARNECPTAFDAGPDFRLSTADGLPAYGPIIKSLTTSGDTSPASALAVDRFPTTPQGTEHYDRRINFSSQAVARAIRNGRGVVVIHGVDYNGNGKYDFAGAGRSELDPSLPAEATDPAICGVLRAK
jgi:hypothetical protein